MGLAQVAADYVRKGLADWSRGSHDKRALD